MKANDEMQKLEEMIACAEEALHSLEKCAQLAKTLELNDDDPHFEYLVSQLDRLYELCCMLSHYRDSFKKVYAYMEAMNIECVYASPLYFGNIEDLYKKCKTAEQKQK